MMNYWHSHAHAHAHSNRYDFKHRFHNFSSIELNLLMLQIQSACACKSFRGISNGFTFYIRIFFFHFTKWNYILYGRMWIGFLQQKKKQLICCNNHAELKKKTREKKIQDLSSKTLNAQVMSLHRKLSYDPWII